MDELYLDDEITESCVGSSHPHTPEHQTNPLNRDKLHGIASFFVHGFSYHFSWASQCVHQILLISSSTGFHFARYARSPSKLMFLGESHAQCSRPLLRSRLFYVSSRRGVYET